MNTRDMVQRCYELLNEEEAEEARLSPGAMSNRHTPVRARDREHLRWALRFMERDPDITPRNFFKKLDELAMGVPYRKDQWIARCKEEKAA